MRRLCCWAAPVLGAMASVVCAYANPPVVARPAARPQIDVAGVALLKRVGTTMFALKSYRAECWTTVRYDPAPGGKRRDADYEMATLTARKPNQIRYDVWTMTVDDDGRWMRTDDTPTDTFVCDGKTDWKQRDDHYQQDTRTRPEDVERDTVAEPWGGFYSLHGSPYAEIADGQKNGMLGEVSRDSVESVEGVPCQKVYTHTKTLHAGHIQKYDTTWYIGPDGLLRRKVEHVAIGGKRGYTRDAILRKIETNFAIPSPQILFAYHPPQGVTLESAQPALLAQGVTAPDFVAVDKNGAAIRLSDYRGKVVVVDFWASWCSSCKESMAHNAAVATKLRGEGLPLVVLAVDNSEERDAFTKWVGAHLEMDALQFAYIDPKNGDVSGATYHAWGLPTWYAIDPRGIIRAASRGYGGPTDALEKAIRWAANPASSGSAPTTRLPATRP